MLLIIGINFSFGQSAPNSLKYQAVLRNSNGFPIQNSTYQFRVSIIADSASGTLCWQELHSKVTSQLGEVIIFIGTGSSTQQGIFPSFDLINWNIDSMFIKIELNNGSGIFMDHATYKFNSDFYSLFSSFTKSTIHDSLINITGVIVSQKSQGDHLIFNGQFWENQNIFFSDSVQFSFGSASTIHCDTSLFTSGLLILPDSVIFSNFSDSSSNSFTSNFTTQSANSFLSDTADFAISFLQQNWNLSGNFLGPGQFLGTTNSQHFKLLTNATDRLLFNGSSGNLSFASNLDSASFSANLIDGFLYSGIGGTYNSPPSSSLFCFFPSKSSLRIGLANGNQFDSINIKNYSSAIGENVTAGEYGFSVGHEISSAGENAIVFGKNSFINITGTASGGTCLSVGDSNIVSSGGRSILLGRNLNTNSLATHVLGWKSSATSSVSLAMGTNCSASSGYSFVLGVNASSSNRTGTFVFSGSSPNVFSSALNNSFNVRAQGGVFLWSDSLQTLGVALLPGSGSWSSVSDMKKKKAIKKLDYESVLLKFKKIEVKYWTYKDQSNSIKHMGVLAQDFHKIFRVGEDSETISVVDADGVVAAGIKGLINRIDNLNFISSSTSEINLIYETLTEDFKKQSDKLQVLESEINNIKDK